MWLATQHGFYSIIQKERDLYFIGACVRKDLENLKELVGLDTEVLTRDTVDYCYRIIADTETLMTILGTLSIAVDYSNFKGRISERADQSSKLGRYHRICEIMADLQHDEDRGPIT